MIPSLLSWIDEPIAAQGIHFAQDSDAWSFRSYESLASRIRCVATALETVGVGPGDTVSLVFYGGEQFVEAFFGTVYRGAIPSPIAPPVAFQQDAVYSAHVTALIETTRPRLILCEDALADALRNALPVPFQPLVRAVGALEAEDSSHSVRRKAQDSVLLQFTSGSSSTPRSVRLSWENLESNVESIRRWLRIGADDPVSSWLPVYHDMGLIGCLLSPVAAQSDIWLMRPDQFIREPARWLRSFDRNGAVATASPNFGCAYVLKRVTAKDLEGCDFSGWRSCVLGAERNDGRTLRRFADFLAPWGFQAQTLLPAYGLAEATLAVAGHAGPAAATAVRVDWSQLAFGALVHVERRTTLADPALGGQEGWLIGCGAPRPGTTVEICGADGAPLPEGHLGEIVVQGPTVGVVDGMSESSGTRLAGGRLLTSDSGFVLEGELFVVGRMGDSLNVRGRRIFAEVVEGALEAVEGVPIGRVAVVGDVVPGFAAVALVEAAGGPWLSQAKLVLSRELGGEPVLVIPVPRGYVPRTSSGKPRRRVLWQSILDHGVFQDGPDALPDVAERSPAVPGAVR